MLFARLRHIFTRNSLHNYLILLLLMQRVPPLEHVLIEVTGIISQGVQPEHNA